MKEVLWLKGLKSISINCDSSGAIQLGKNPTYLGRTKNVDVRMHFIRDEIRNLVISVVKIPSEVNPTKMLTKPLPTIKFRNSLILIGAVIL